MGVQLLNYCSVCCALELGIELRERSTGRNDFLCYPVVFLGNLSEHASVTGLQIMEWVGGTVQHCPYLGQQNKMTFV